MLKFACINCRFQWGDPKAEEMPKPGRLLFCPECGQEFVMVSNVKEGGQVLYRGGRPVDEIKVQHVGKT